MNIKPLVIPIFIPHSGCPHQCAFCNQSIITEQFKDTAINRCREKALSKSDTLLPSTEQIRQEVEQFLTYKGSREEVQLAFFGGNFLGLEPEEISMLLSSAQELVDEKKIDSIRFSTRPDTITRERLELIAPYPVSTIELGVQSMDNRVLEMARRGHTEDDTIRAASLLMGYRVQSSSGHNRAALTGKSRSYIEGPKWGLGERSLQIGMQMMVGLPGENYERAVETAEKIALLKPDFVRIYPLIVLEGSLIARWYREGKYTPLSLDSCVKLVKELFLIFKSHNIPVIRMGLQASDLLQDKLSMLAGPWHPAFGHLVYSEIFFDMAVNLIKQKVATQKSNHNSNKVAPDGKAGDNYFANMKNINIDEKAAGYGATIIMAVHPSSISRLQGDKSQNIKRLKDIYPSFEFKIKADKSLDRDEIKILHPVAYSKPI